MSQSTTKIPDLKGTLTCTQMMQLKDLASKKFEPVIGEKYWGDSSDIGNHFYSKQEFGIKYSTGISTYNLDNPFVQKEEPYLRFELYLGKDSIRAQIEYLNLIHKLDKCLIPLGFEKKIDRTKGGNPQFDHSVFIKEVADYHSSSHHARFRIILSDPTNHDGVVTVGRPTEIQLPSELIKVQVFHYK